MDRHSSCQIFPNLHPAQSRYTYGYRNKEQYTRTMRPTVLNLGKVFFAPLEIPLPPSQCMHACMETDLRDLHGSKLTSTCWAEASLCAVTSSMHTIALPPTPRSRQARSSAARRTDRSKPDSWLASWGW